MKNEMMSRILYLILAGCLVLLFNCRQRSAERGTFLFQALEASRTGLDFSNKLTPTQEFNVFKYMYFYNGGGVGAADFNNDGKIDIFFAANQVSNRLYLNMGNLQFKDVTTEAQIP